MIDWIQGLDYGDVPTWIASLATSSALLLAVITVLRDQNDRRKRDEHAASEQARAIHLSQVEISGGSGTTGSHLNVPVSVRVSNLSEEVIHDVRLRLFIEPPDAALEHRDHAVEFAILVPGQKETFRITPSIGYPTPKSTERNDFTAHPELEFTDLAGVRWKRDRDYRLSRLK